MRQRRDSKFWIVNKLAGGVAEMLIYSDIGRWDDGVSASGFVKELRQLEGDHSLINLRFNSNGGSVYEGIGIVNAIAGSKCPIDGYVDGLAASMASVVLAACRKAYMSQYARIMTHKPSGGAWGGSKELRTVADELDALEKIANKLYQKRTGMSEEDVTAKLLNDKDNFFGADEALKMKLVDDIYDGEEVDLPKGVDKNTMWNAYDLVLRTRIEEPKHTILLSL